MDMNHEYENLAKIAKLIVCVKCCRSIVNVHVFCMRHRNRKKNQPLMEPQPMKIMLSSYIFVYFSSFFAYDYYYMPKQGR